MLHLALLRAVWRSQIARKSGAAGLLIRYIESSTKFPYIETFNTISSINRNMIATRAKQWKTAWQFFPRAADAADLKNCYYGRP